MKTKTYIRILLVVMVASTSLFLFSYSRKKTEPNVERSTECGGNKACDKKTQSDFILWESLTRNLLSARG